MSSALREVEDVVDAHTGHARTVLEYTLVMKGIVDRAKEPGFGADDWAPLAELVAVDDFDRVGNFKERMDWDEYVAFLTAWAPARHWECSFKRITEVGDLVFLELEERSGSGPDAPSVNSLSVYEMDAAGRIRHIDIYLQMAMPGGLPKSYGAADAS